MNNTDWTVIWAKMKREGRFVTLNTQKYTKASEFSSSWNTFVFYESARATKQMGYDCHPLAIINDVLFTGA